MSNRLRTILLVSFFSVLIWAFAEGESLQTQRTVAEVSFPSLVPEGWSVRVPDGQSWRGRVELSVEGPTASLDGLESVLRQALAVEPGMVEGLPRQSGEFTVDLRQALRAHQVFRSRGIAVLSVEPPTVRVLVDELATVELPVVIDAPADALAGPPQLVGASAASVRIPKRIADALPAGAGLRAPVRSEALTPLREGVRSTIQVRLEPDGALAGALGTESLVISPAQVSVQVTVRSKTETIVVPSVVVDLRLQPTELGKWDITLDDASLRDVRVTGPSDLIALIREEKLPIRAFVRLSYEDLESGVTSKRAEFSDYTNFPGVMNLRFEVEDIEVGLTIRPRQAPGDPPTPAS
ncbi:MAG: hypothetical protein IT431_00360 [Phycisphaerales bacterium]|nr:hypothetical protein [Phycisphaerales bacterium]